MRGYQPQVESMTSNYKGANTALQFSQLSPEQSARLKNAYMTKVGAIGKRPGSVPLTTTALGAAIPYLTVYDGVVGGAAGDIYGSSGSTLYKYASAAWVGQTMTNPLNSASIYTVGFKNASGTTRLIIADGASIKQLDSATSAVTNITPAANDAAPAPANILAAVNALGIDFVWVHKGTIYVSDGSDTYWYMKRYQFDYIPSVQYEQLVRNNDYINGCGVSYNDVLLVPMRRGWNITKGTTVDNIDATEFLNTTNGVIAPRSIAKMTYPNGGQTIPYLSDDGVHEVYNIADETGGVNQYATRSLMKDKIDFIALGLTEAEKAAAVGYFNTDLNVYVLSFNQGLTRLTYAYDVRNGEWYTDWTGFNAQAYVTLDDTLYFAGSSGHLHKFDTDLVDDWADVGQTTQNPVVFQRYGALKSLEKTGYSSYWDYYVIEMKQYAIPSSLDVTMIFTDSSLELPTAVDTNSAVWDVTDWDDSYWANEDFTENVNEPRRYVYKKKSKYVQELWENARSEPIEIYWDKWIGRTSGQ